MSFFSLGKYVFVLLTFTQFLTGCSKFKANPSVGQDSANTASVATNPTPAAATPSATVRFFIDAKAYNPESTETWTEIQPGAVTEIYLGSIRQKDLSPPQITLRVLATNDSVSNCSAGTMDGITVSTTTVTPQEFKSTFTLKSDSPRNLNNDFNLCGRLSSGTTTLNLKIKGEVQ